MGSSLGTYADSFSYPAQVMEEQAGWLLTVQIRKPPPTWVMDSTYVVTGVQSAPGSSTQELVEV